MIDISGYLSEFSLAEVFQFLEQGTKSGMLSIQDKTEPVSSHYIWFRQGRIVASANRLDGLGLISLLDQRKFLASSLTTKMKEFCPPQTPLGLYLKSKSAIDAEQLKMAFSIQVIRSVCALFALTDAWFEFDNQVPSPFMEMTGLSSPATEVTLAGLRALKDWNALAEKLPQPTSALISMVAGQPQISINQTEWQVWEYTKGNVSLEQIAQELRLPIEKVQQIAFRLIIICLAQEIPILADKTATTNSLAEQTITSEPSVNPEKNQVTSSFLEGLLGFLRTRT